MVTIFNSQRKTCGDKKSTEQWAGYFSIICKIPFEDISSDRPVKCSFIWKNSQLKFYIFSFSKGLSSKTNQITGIIINYMFISNFIRKLWTIFRWVRRRGKIWLQAANGLFRCLTKLLTIENAHAPNTMNSMGKITIDLAAKISRISHFPSVHNPDSCSNFFPTQINVFWVDYKFLVALKRCSNSFPSENFSLMSIIWTRYYRKNSIVLLDNITVLSLYKCWKISYGKEIFYRHFISFLTPLLSCRLWDAGYFV